MSNYINKFQYLIFRLFILRIGNNKNKAEYRIAYGVVNPASSPMTKPNISGSTDLGSFGGHKCSMYVVLMADTRDKIVGIYEDLIQGISIKEAFNKRGIDHKNLGFDVTYTQRTIMIPWSAEQVCDSQMAFSTYACMLDPQELFVYEGQQIHESDKALAELNNYLSKKTYLPFGDKYDHAGNLEVIATPDRDVNGKKLVFCQLEKSKPFVQHIKIASALIDGYDSVSINVRNVVAGRIMGDTLISFPGNSGNDTVVDLPVGDKIGTFEINIWLTKDKITNLVHRSTYHYISSISLNMNVIGMRVQATTAWLEKIRENVPKNKEKEVDEAGQIEHISKEQYRICFNNATRKERLKLVKSVVKCNDEFFAKGWNSKTDEIGRLRFLRWFKNKANGSKQVFLQDPYFEDVALYFLASSDANSEYTVLTQTRLTSNPNGTTNIAKEGNRKENIVNAIKAYPTLFSPLKLVIKDLSTDGALLHDRYLVFTYPDGGMEAYMLSNSLQGSTIKQPLLVTQIGDKAFEKVRKHISEVYSSGNVEVLYDYRVKEDGKPLDEIADMGFYEWLKTQQDSALRGDIKPILDDILNWKTLDKLSTTGYYLANIPDADAQKIMENAANRMKGDSKWIEVLKDFILDKHYSNYPIGYIGCPHNGYNFYNVTHLLEGNYKKIVTPYNIKCIENLHTEGHSYGVWGQLFSCKLLLMLSEKDAVHVLKLLKPTLVRIKGDKSITPVYKVTNILMTEMFETVLWGKDDTLMKILLAESEEWCRAIGALLLIHKAKSETFHLENYKEYFWKDDEIIRMCNAAWATKPPMTNRSAFYQWLVEVFNRANDVDRIMEIIIPIMRESHLPEDKEEYVKEVICPLIDKGILIPDKVSYRLIEELFDASINEDSYIQMQYVLPAVLVAIDGAISPLEDKVKEVYVRFDRALRSIVVSNDDTIFEVSKKAINMRNMLIALENYYGGKSNITIDHLRTQLAQLDKRLDEVGLEKF